MTGSLGIQVCLTYECGTGLKRPPAREPHSPPSSVPWYVSIFPIRSCHHLISYFSWDHQLERPELHPPFLIDGHPPHPPLKFAICVAGFRPRGCELADLLFEQSYNTPTLHILGRTDVIVVEERAKTLLDVSAGKRAIWHDGGECQRRLEC
jgi:hypothetical protein